MKFDTLILDCDGVLCEAWGFARYLDEHSITQEMRKDFFTGIFLECLIGQADLKQVLPEYLSRWGWPGSLDEFLKIWFAEDGHVDMQLINYAKDLRKNGVSVFVGTNQEHYRTQHLKNDLKFAEYFDGVLSSSTLGAMKPNIQFFRAAEQIVKTDPSRILFWDDSDHYLKGAIEAGWQTEKYTNFQNFAEKMKSYL